MSRKHLPVHRIPWPKALTWMRGMVREMREDQDEYGHFEGVYGIPRGGVYPATVVSVALDLPIVADPDEVECCVIVDDDAASGATLSRYEDALLNGRHVAAVVHARSQAMAPMAYHGALEECPPGHRLLWPWREGPTPLPKAQAVIA